MSEFEPTIGKWNDCENYDIQEPKWRTLLDIARRRRDVSDVCRVMAWLVGRGIENDRRFDYLACYGIIGKSFCLDEEARDILYTAELEHIARFPENIHGLKDYAAMVLKETYVPEEIIKEFQSAYEDIIGK